MGQNSTLLFSFIVWQPPVAAAPLIGEAASRHLAIDVWLLKFPPTFLLIFASVTWWLS